MIWEINPHVGIDSIKLGASRDDIVAQMGEPDTGSTDLVLYYSSTSRLALSFDVKGALEYVEANWDHVSRPRAILGGIELFDAPADDVVGQLSKLSAGRIEEGGYSAAFDDLDILLWRPILPSQYDDDDPAEDEYRRGLFWMTVGVGRRGYLRDRVEGATPS